MASIPLPALSVKAPEDPLQSYGKVMGLQQMMQQQQSGAIDLQMKQQQQKDQQTVMQVLAKHGGDMTSALPELSTKVSLPTLKDLQKFNLDTREKLAKIHESELPVLKDQNDRLSQLVNMASQLPPDQYQAQWPQLAQAALKIKPDLQLDPNKPLPPQQLQQVGLGLLTTEQYIKQEAEKRAAKMQPIEEGLKVAETGKDTAQGNEAQQKADQLARQSAATQLAQASDQRSYDQIRGKMPYGLASQFPGKFDKQKILQMGMSPDQQVATGLEGAKLAETKRHNIATEGQLTPEAIKMAADQFAATGKLPDVGRNNAARAQIINQASLDHPNIPLNSAEYKANVESLKALQKNLDSVSAFENTAKKNLDLFLTQAKNVVDSGSPLLNKPLRSIAKGSLGSADQAAYDAARQVAVNEIAKVTSSPGLTGVLSDSARHEVDNFNPGNATLAQTYKVAQVLTQDMANRHESYDQQIQAIKNRIGKGAQSAKPNTPEQPSGDNPFAQFGGVKH